MTADDFGDGHHTDCADLEIAVITQHPSRTRSTNGRVNDVTTNFTSSAEWSSHLVWLWFARDIAVVRAPQDNNTITDVASAR